VLPLAEETDVGEADDPAEETLVVAAGEEGTTLAIPVSWSSEGPHARCAP
jgi:hypothetical protein